MDAKRPSGRAIIAVALIVCVTAAARNILLLDVAVAATDDDYVAEFSSLYGGDGNDSDVYAADAALRQYAWTRGYLGSSKLNQVRWWSVIGEDPAHPGEFSDNTDFLYLSTHGPESTVPVAERPYTVVMNSVGDALDYIYADQVDGDYSYPCVVPSTWRLYPTQTYSKWDNDLEWVVISACLQLDYQPSVDDGAHEYAESMVGYPRRVHSILSYDLTAPDYPADDEIIREFIRYQNQRDLYRSVEYAWETVNEEEQEEDWAMIYHVANRGETTWRPLFGPSGSTVLPDTSTSQLASIKLIHSSINHIHAVPTPY